MKNFKSHFWYNSRQRNGILFLVIIIICLQSIYFFSDFSTEKKENITTDEIALFEKQIDSLKLIELEKRKPKIYPYNPSFITDYKGYKLGLSTAQIDRLHAHRSKGLYINSAKQFQQITEVSDSLLAILSPNFKFPDWINQKKKTVASAFNKPKNEVAFSGEKKDLNTVTSIQLKEINGIGDKLSERIVKYRNSIKGFQNDKQLKSVYGLKPEVVEKIMERYTVLSKPTINKINVNTATFKEVLHLPYIDYELTKKIFNYRDEVAEIQDINELKNIEGFPLEDFDKIILYLTAK